MLAWRCDEDGIDVEMFDADQEETPLPKQTCKDQLDGGGSHWRLPT